MPQKFLALVIFLQMLGVVQILQVVNEQAPVVQSTNLTSGLMQAVVATVAGLLVAVPCHVMYSLLMVRIERIVLDMEASVRDRRLSDQTGHVDAVRAST